MESIRENNVNIHSKKFAKKITGKHRTSSDVSADPFYSESNIRYLNGIANDSRLEKRTSQNTNFWRMIRNKTNYSLQVGKVIYS